MSTRFEPSAPPSIDKIYRDVPVGPWGVPPFIRPAHDFRQKPLPIVSRGGIASSIRQVGLRLLGMIRPVRAGFGMAPSRTRGMRSCPGA